MTRDRLNEHKENMDKIMDRLGGRRDDIWQDRFIYDIAAAIHDLLVEKERKKERVMDETKMRLIDADTVEECNKFFNTLKILVLEHPIVADWWVEIINREDDILQNGKEIKNA